METVPGLMPSPAVVVQQKGKPIVIRPPEVSAAHDMAVIGFILTFLLSLPWLILSLIIGGIGVAAYLGYLILPPALPPAIAAIPYIGPFLIFVTLTLTPSFWIYIGLGGGALLVTLIFLLVLYFTTVSAINRGKYEKARNSLLFFGVIFIIPTFFILFAPTTLAGTIVAIIPAFFFLMSYGRLGEVIAKYGPVAIMGEAVPGSPISGVPPPIPIPPTAISMMGAPMQALAGPPMGPTGGAMNPTHEPLTGVAPRIPLCPGCGRDLYYSANHRRWYCMTCDSGTTHR